MALVDLHNQAVERRKVLGSEITHMWQNMFDTEHGCGICGDPIVYGDERNMWLGYHQSWYHKMHRAIVRFFVA